MKIYLSSPYVGNITNRVPLETGENEVSEEVAEYLLTKRPDIATLEEASSEESFLEKSSPLDSDGIVVFKDDEKDDDDDFIDGELPIIDLSNLSEEDFEDIDTSEETNESVNQFFCCGKDWGNQGTLNFHRRNKKCPNTTSKK